MILLATLMATKAPVKILHFFTNEHGSPKAIILNGNYLEAAYLDELEAVQEIKDNKESK